VSGQLRGPPGFLRQWDGVKGCCSSVFVSGTFDAQWAIMLYYGFHATAISFKVASMKAYPFCGALAICQSWHKICSFVGFGNSASSLTQRLLVVQSPKPCILGSNHKMLHTQLPSLPLHLFHCPMFLPNPRGVSCLASLDQPILVILVSASVSNPRSVVPSVKKYLPPMGRSSGRRF
jgi:hypothetical protein